MCRPLSQCCQGASAAIQERGHPVNQWVFIIEIKIACIHDGWWAKKKRSYNA